MKPILHRTLHPHHFDDMIREELYQSMNNYKSVELFCREKDTLKDSLYESGISLQRSSGKKEIIQ